MLMCVDGVLATSGYVARYFPAGRGDERKRYIILRNSPGVRSSGLGLSIVPSSGTPRELVIEYTLLSWQSGGGMKPPPDPQVTEMEAESMAEISTSLLQAVGAECLPSAPGSPVCSRVAQGRGGRCSLGA
jgi:hypothetical protein